MVDDIVLVVKTVSNQSKQRLRRRELKLGKQLILIHRQSIQRRHSRLTREFIGHFLFINLFNIFKTILCIALS